MRLSRLLVFYVFFTVLGLLVARQQIAETLLLYQIQDQERLAKNLGDQNQILRYQVSRLASSERLKTALTKWTLPLEGSPVAVVRVGSRQKRPLRVADKRKGLFERLSLIRAAEARSR